MRRIYESDDLDRDDDDPFRPNRRDARTTPRAARTLPAGLLSSYLIPAGLRRRAISLDVSTARTVYEPGTPISVTVTMKNSMPFPVTISTRSPLLWTWHVDGYREASHVAEDPPAGSGAFTFDRGERKRFERTWPQLFRVSASRWEDASPGEYTISAAINVDGSASGLEDATTVRIE